MGLVELKSDLQDKPAKYVVIKPPAHALLMQIRASIGPDLNQVSGSLDDKRPNDNSTLTAN